MAKKPEIMEVEVTATSNSADPCDVSFALGNIHIAGTLIGSAPHGKQLYFNNNRHPGFIVIFRIVDNQKSPTHCQFLPNPDDAMWVQRSDFQDAPCPNCPAYWDQFMAIDVADEDVGGKTVKNQILVVSNKNDYQQYFAFTLRFEIPGCGKIVDFDPIGNNQNGPQ